MEINQRNFLSEVECKTIISICRSLIHGYGEHKENMKQEITDKFKKHPAYELMKMMGDEFVEMGTEKMLGEWEKHQNGITEVLKRIEKKICDFASEVHHIEL